MPKPLSRPGLATLLAAVLCLQACHGASSSNRAEPPRSPSGTSSDATPLAMVRFRRATFHLPSAIQREVGVILGGDVYIAGGLNGSDTSVATVLKVDPHRGVVQTAGEMSRRFHDGAGAAIGKRLVVFGGGTGSGSAIVQSYSPSHGVAAIDGSLPRALSDLSAATLDGITYLIGGYDGVSAQRIIYATSDGRRFHRAALLPVGLRYAAAAAFGTKVLIAGGETTDGPSRSVLSFDPSTGNVRTVGQLPRSLGHASAFTANGVLYVVGGVDASGRTLQTIVAVDPGSGRVSSAGKLPAPLSDAATVVLGNQAWLFGGLRGKAVSDVLVASISPT